MATWSELYRAAQHLEATAANDLAAAIEEVHLATVGTLDAPVPDSYTMTTLGILVGLDRARRGRLPGVDPGFCPPPPRLQTVAGAAPM